MLCVSAQPPWTDRPRPGVPRRSLLPGSPSPVRGQGVPRLSPFRPGAHLWAPWITLKQLRSPPLRDLGLALLAQDWLSVHHLHCALRKGGDSPSGLKPPDRAHRWSPRAPTPQAQAAAPAATAKPSPQPRSSSAQLQRPHPGNAPREAGGRVSLWVPDTAHTLSRPASPRADHRPSEGHLVARDPAGVQWQPQALAGVPPQWRHPPGARTASGRWPQPLPRHADLRTLETITPGRPVNIIIFTRNQYASQS